MRDTTLGLTLSGFMTRPRQSLFARAISAIRRNGGTLIGLPDNVLGDGAPNLLSAPEFAGGLADAPVRSGLLTLASMSGYDNAIAFGRDGVTVSYAYKQTTFTAGAVYALSVIVQMDDGLAPSFSDAGGSASVNNSFALVIRGNATAPSTNVVTSLGGGLFRVSCYDGNSGAGMQNIGVVKYPTNDTRTFKVTGYKLELGSVATAYTPQSVLRTRGTYIDSAGTTPVTAVGDLVGLTLDRMGTVGPNAAPLTTAWFSLGTGITQNTSTGTLTFSATPSGQSAYRGVALTANKTYSLEFVVSSISGGGLQLVVGGGAGTAVVTTPGTYRAIVKATSPDGPYLGAITSAVTAVVTSVICKEITGNHATQATTASKPLVSRVPKRLGPNLVVNGDGSDATGWTVSGGSLASIGGEFAAYLRFKK